MLLFLAELTGLQVTLPLNYDSTPPGRQALGRPPHPTASKISSLVWSHCCFRPPTIRTSGPEPCGSQLKIFQKAVMSCPLCLKMCTGEKETQSPEMQHRKVKVHGERGGEEQPGKAGTRAKLPCSLRSILLSLNSNNILCVGDTRVPRWKRVLPNFPYGLES